MAIPNLFLGQGKNMLVTMLIGLFLGSLIVGCKTTNKPDISGIEVDINIQRFEKDLFAIDSSNYQGQLAQLQQKYPNFYSLYTDELLSLRTNPKMSKEEQLLFFVKNKDIKALYDSCQFKYNDFNSLEQSYSTAFKYFKYHFPNRKIPTIITHISEFGPAVSNLDSTLIAVSLDMFLGKDFPFYESIRLPQYLTHRLDKPYIVPSSLQAYAQGLFDADLRNRPFIDQVIQEGKILYFLDLLLPDTPDHLKIGFTPEQLSWCRNSEASIWAYLIEKEMLYENSQREIAKYIEEAPTTKGMPPESPGRVGLWVGWQIVRQYMKQHPNTTLEQLMNTKDGKGSDFLKRSRYKPSK